MRPVCASEVSLVADWHDESTDRMSESVEPSSKEGHEGKLVVAGYLCSTVSSCS